MLPISCSGNRFKVTCFRMIYGLLYDVVEELSMGYGISKAIKECITDSCKFSFLGVMMDWVRNGMKEPPKQLMGKRSRMTCGQLPLAI